MQIEVIKAVPSASGGGALIGAAGDNYGGQLVSMMFPGWLEMARRNRGWRVMNTSAVAALVVRPSTTAHGTLYNNNSAASAIALIVTHIFAFNLVTTAAVSAWNAWTCVHPTGRAADTADITAIKSISGKSGSYGGGAIFDNGATVTDDGWFPNGPNTNTNGVTTASGGSAAIPCLYIVPPTAAISVAPVSTIVGTTFTVGFEFYEIALPVGE